MTNPNTQPVIMIGQLTENSYPSAQAFAEALVAVLGIPLDTISIIKGAKGETGPKGSKGDKGANGSNGNTVKLNTINLGIPENATYIDIDYTEDWASHIYKITYNGAIGGGTSAYDPSVAGIVSIGTMIPIYATPVTKIRVFFMFQAGTSGPITGVPSTGHRLSITKVVLA